MIKKIPLGQSQSGFHKAQEDRESFSVDLRRENAKFIFLSDAANFENIKDCAHAANYLTFPTDFCVTKTTFKVISHLGWCIFEPTPIRPTAHPTY